MDILRTAGRVRIGIVFALCFLIRLIPFRPPNIEPLLAAQMPFAKAYGKTVGFLFGVMSIVLFDAVTGRFGVWTIVTACAYGLLGVWASVYFSGKQSSALSYVKFAVMGTIAYDALTGLTIGPVFFHQPFLAVLVGQIPFTGMHLLGTIVFAAVLGPALYRYAVAEKAVIIHPVELVVPA